jgi:hypothetical protein
LRWTLGIALALTLITALVFGYYLGIDYIANITQR